MNGSYGFGIICGYVNDDRIFTLWKANPIYTFLNVFIMFLILQCQSPQCTSLVLMLPLSEKTQAMQPP